MSRTGKQCRSLSFACVSAVALEELADNSESEVAFEIGSPCPKDDSALLGRDRAGRIKKSGLADPCPPSTTKSPPRRSSARIAANSDVRSISLIKQAIVVREICYAQRPRSYRSRRPPCCMMWYALRFPLTSIETGQQMNIAPACLQRSSLWAMKCA